MEYAYIVLCLEEGYPNLDQIDVYEDLYEAEDVVAELNEDTDEDMKYICKPATKKKG